VIGFILCRTKSLVCKDALHRESTIQKYFRRFCLQVRRFLVPCQPSERPCHPVRTLIFPLFHPSGGPIDQASFVRTTWIFFPEPSLYREASVPACIRPDVSAASPDAFQYSSELQILSKFIYGKIAATVRTMWIPVQTRFSLRQESQFKYNRPDVCQHGPNVRAFDKEIAYSTSTVRMSTYHGPDAR